MIILTIRPRPVRGFRGRSLHRIEEATRNEVGAPGFKQSAKLTLDVLSPQSTFGG